MIPVMSLSLDKRTKSTLFPESLTRKMYRKKIPEIAKVLSKCPNHEQTEIFEHPAGIMNTILLGKSSRRYQV